MVRIVICPKCGFVGSIIEDDFIGIPDCPDCGSKLEDSGYSKEVWNMLNTNQKREIIQTKSNSGFAGFNQLPTRKKGHSFLVTCIIAAVAFLFVLGGKNWINSLTTCSACGKYFIGTSYSPDNGTHILCFDCAYDYKKGVIAIDDGINLTEENYPNDDV